MLVTNPILLVESPNFISDVSDDDVNDDVDEEDKYDDHMRYYWGKLVIYPFHLTFLQSDMAGLMERTEFELGDREKETKREGKGGR